MSIVLWGNDDPCNYLYTCSRLNILLKCNRLCTTNLTGTINIIRHHYYLRFRFFLFSAFSKLIVSWSIQMRFNLIMLFFYIQKIFFLNLREHNIMAKRLSQNRETIGDKTLEISFTAELLRVKLWRIQLKLNGLEFHEKETDTRCINVNINTVEIRGCSCYTA